MKARPILRRLQPLLAVMLFLITARTLLAEDRWLLIFDTSSSMKKRLPAVDAEVTKLFVATGGDHIHAGDSVGIWTFGTQLHAGELPLFTYLPENAAAITTNVLGYVHKQKYAGDTTFELLQPIIGTVIQHSERLTIIIFCDGEGQLEGTPYDYGINQSLLDSVPERKKTKQPAVIILRTQLGKFVGGTANFPPAPSDVPSFPPLPAPPVVVAKPVVVSEPVKPEPSLPPLIINGTSISTNPDAIPTSAPKPVVNSNPAPSVPPATAPFEPAPPTPVTVAATPAPAPETMPPSAPAPTPVATPAPAPTPVPAPETSITPVTAPANPAQAVNTTTNVAAPVPPPAENGVDLGTKILLVVGGIFFGMATLLVIFFLTRRKAPETSLITSLMNDDPNRRK